MSEIRNLKPGDLWRDFDDLTQVPRPSGLSEKIQKFLLDFATRISVESYVDADGNVVMHRPATPGYENHKTVLLQTHMDMVPQKAPDSNRNFETDPIVTHIMDGWVYANNTTFGADDGTGVTAIMAVMESKTLKHGIVEALITRDKGASMYSVNGIPSGELHSDILMNLDPEAWGKFITSFVGDIGITSTIAYKGVVNNQEAAVKVTLKGLRDGHSGPEINEGRADANKETVRFVRNTVTELGVRLAPWEGGNARSAVPFKAEVILTLPQSKVPVLRDMVAHQKALLRDKFKGIESNVGFFIGDVERPADLVPADVQEKLINVTYTCRNGVLRMIPSYPDAVETSSNLAAIHIEPTKATIMILARSSRGGMRDYISAQLESYFDMTGMKTIFSGQCGGWDPNPNSEILNLLKRVYKEQNGVESTVQADHAGLKYSVTPGEYPGVDVVSLGPTPRSPHTAKGRLEIATVEPFWELLIQTLEGIPVKQS